MSPAKRRRRFGITSASYLAEVKCRSPFSVVSALDFQLSGGWAHFTYRLGLAQRY
jgi:hypothetical protein